MAKVDCVVCGHMHREGEPCDLCHCASGVLEHPQGKPPIAERFKDVALSDIEADEESERELEEKDRDGTQDAGGREASRR